MTLSRRSRLFVFLLLFLVAAPLGHAQEIPADPRFDATRALLTDYVEANRIAGAVALVIDDGEVVLHEAFGWKDRAAEEQMETDQLFRIASMTKPVTSVAIMMLVEEGKVQLDDPLEKFVPEFASIKVVPPGAEPEDAVPARRSITIHDLLTHTSGLTYGFFGQQPHARLYNEAGISEGLGHTQLTLAENTRRLATIPLVQHPGESWHYGLSTDVLGRVVEVASNQPFDTFVRERILEPLGMHDTWFVLPEDQVNRLATLYRPAADGTIRPAGPGDTSFQQPGDSNYRSGGAGLVSTAHDYARFLRMLLAGGELDGERLLQPETVEAMTRNQIGDLNIAFQIHGDRFGYGFGVHSEASDMLNGSAPGTYSWGGIFYTYFWVDPHNEVIGVLMAQISPFGNLDLWGRFESEVYEAISVPAAEGTGANRLQAGADAASVVRLWPDRPPGPAALTDGPEADRQRPEDRLVGGRTVMKIGNVSTPEMHVYLPEPEAATGAACVVCPGGGFNILAWDLEGTEVAEWLNSIGTAAIILKYRVPTRQHGDPGKWEGPVMDAQRALSLTRHHAEEWGIDPERLGILGFSAGGQTAAMTAVLQGKRLYEPVDRADDTSCTADFAVLVYPGGIVDDQNKLQDVVAVDRDTPPMFLVHAADDRVKCEASVMLFLALREAGVPAELHVFSEGGHGYGLRPAADAVTRWPTRTAEWMREQGFAGHRGALETESGRPVSRGAAETAR